MATKPRTKAAPSRRQQLVAALTTATDLDQARATALALLKAREAAGLHKDAVPTKDQFLKFFTHVEIREGGCWQWTGKVTADGLPLFGDCPINDVDTKGKTIHGARLKPKVPMGHRTAWHWFRGLLLPYPHWRLTQTCGHKGCVQPAHLRQVRVEERPPVTVTTATLGQVFGQVQVVPYLGGSNCWLWTGAVNAGGFAVTSFAGQPVQSVDLLTLNWFRGYGPGETSATHQVYHYCLRRRCINPAHYSLVPFQPRKGKKLGPRMKPAGVSA